jgi:DNA end-binding protein Ku
VARAIWSGTIAFGLVSVPVRMESAVEEHTLHFNYVHEPDGGRIGYQRVCKAEDRPVPDDEVVKAFEIKKGKWVYLSDKDFEAAQLEQRGKTIDIQAFVARDEIDPIFFERTYYLTPQEGGEKVYALLARAMEEAELVAVATLVMREREHLACLRVRERVITLERMHFADEVPPAKDLAPKGVRVAKDELELAARLVDQYTGKFRPESFKDTYRDALRKIIRARERGKPVAVAEPEEPEAPIDLMAALCERVESARSVAAAEGARAPGGKRLPEGPARGLGFPERDRGKTARVKRAGGLRAEQAREREEREAVRSPEGQGHVQGAGRPHRQLAGLVEPRRQEVRLGRQLVPGRHHGPEEGRRPQGRKGDGEEAELGHQLSGHASRNASSARSVIAATRPRTARPTAPKRTKGVRVLFPSDTS